MCGREAGLFPAISISVWEEKALRAPAPAATEAGAELRRPYLSLKNQLLGEQHGLLAERLRLLQTPRRVPGPPRALDTWGRGEGGRGVRHVSQTNHKAAQAHFTYQNGRREQPNKSKPHNAGKAASI